MRVLRNAAAVLAVLLLSGLAHTGELEGVNLMLDNIQKAHEDHDINLLSAQCSDEGMLLLGNHPDPLEGAFALEKQQVMQAMKNQIWKAGGLEKRLITNRRIAVRDELAFIRMTINDHFKGGKVSSSEVLIVAKKSGSSWKACFGMPHLADGRVIATKVAAGSSAEKAGIKEGDIIVKCDGASLDPILSGPAVTALLKSGKDLSLVLERSGTEVELQTPPGIPGATVETVLVPAGEAVFYGPENPHPVKELMGREIDALRTGSVQTYQGILDPSGYFSYRRDSSAGVRLIARKHAEEMIEKQLAESRQAVDPSSIRLQAVTAIATPNLAIASGMVSATTPDGTPFEAHTRLQVFARRGETWGLVADLIDRFGLAAGTTSAVRLSPDETQQANRETEGRITGIGVKLAQHDNGVLIREVLPGKPAQNAGIRDGDIIISIDGRPSRGMTNEQAVKAITGEAGTQVTLEVQGPSGGKRTVTITRETIDLPGVESNVLGDRIGYLKITAFNKQTPSAVRTALTTTLTARNTRGIVLDLRGNTGGLYDVVVQVARFLIPGNPPKVLWIVRQSGKQPQSVEAKSKALTALPLVVLVDAKTAGAAELLAGALKQHSHATLVGVKTAGAAALKQRVENLDGSSSIIQIGDFLFPQTGKTGLDGVLPDVIAPDPAPEKVLELGKEKLTEILGR